MALPNSWRGFPQTHECPGAFRVSFCDLEVDDEWRTINIRSIDFFNRVDVLRKLAAAGLTFTDLQERGILKAVRVQNLDADDDAEWAEVATAGTDDAPTPADGYSTLQANGGGVSVNYPTSEEAYAFFYRAEDGQLLSRLDFQVWFDVPPEA